MRLGYLSCGGREKRVGAGFNEAEAHAPRIHPAWFTMKLPASSFNEAEAHAPRIP